MGGDLLTRVTRLGHVAGPKYSTTHVYRRWTHPDRVRRAKLRGLLPASLRNARQLSNKRELAKADPAKPKLADERTRTPASTTTIVPLDLKLEWSLGLLDLALLGHGFLSLLCADQARCSRE